MRPPEQPATWQVEADADDATAAAVFATDRLWNGYSLADLAPPLRAFTTVAVACQHDAHASAAACLFYRHPSFNSLIPHGAAAGIAAILAQANTAGALPQETFALAQAEQLAALARWYDFLDGRHEMLRMAVDAGTFRAPAERLARVERLGAADLEALRDLYAAYPESAFTADQLQLGVFYGVHDGAALVAAGGTHVVAPRYAIAAVGNVFTRPAARGHGYARAITAAVTAELLTTTCRDIILNVAVENAAALHVYASLGFHPHCRYWEGRARLRRGASR
ncbi:MAG TPA: GNAT family N-acetyltransferase [Thermomicrobiales bacterium]|nr:GNAT family N-acetyltransferase [Thermomicrobiales bacterium]